MYPLKVERGFLGGKPCVDLKAAHWELLLEFRLYDDFLDFDPSPCEVVLDLAEIHVQRRVAS